MRLRYAIALLSGLAVVSSACASAPAAAPPPVPTSANLPVVASSSQGGSAAPTPTRPVPAASPVRSPVANDGRRAVDERDSDDFGTILTDVQGHTLYRYDRDRTDLPTCTAGCAQIWPPLTLTSGSPTGPSDLPGSLGTTTAGDGARQVTYNGIPLYRYVVDADPEDTNGDGIGGLWHVVQPDDVAQ